MSEINKGDFVVKVDNEEIIYKVIDVAPNGYLCSEFCTTNYKRRLDKKNNRFFGLNVVVKINNKMSNI